MDMHTASHRMARLIPATAGGNAYGMPNFRGEAGRPLWTGWLTGIDLTCFEAERQHIDFTVYSYGTPIAWHMGDGGWYFVHQKFSVSTSKHQGAIRGAVAYVERMATL